MVDFDFQYVSCVFAGINFLKLVNDRLNRTIFYRADG